MKLSRFKKLVAQVGVSKVDIAFGVLAGLTLAGCASFTYRYYTLDAASYVGTLKGPDESQDLPFERCKPTDTVKAPCVVQFVDEHLAMKQDLIQCHSDLQDCQKKCQ